MSDKRFRNRLFFLIRLALIASIVANLAVAVLMIWRDRNVSGGEIAGELTERLELIIWAVITLVLSFGSDYIERVGRMDIPDILEIVIVIFIYAGIFLSVRFKLYYRFWWWDDLLHTLSGVIIGFIGFIVVYKVNHKFSMDISPLLVAMFSFTFAVTLGVMWEILEFVSDLILGTAHQKWDLPDDSIMMGRGFQGSGLRDTMSDLIVDSVGALITSIITFFMYRNKKNKKQMIDSLRDFIGEDDIDTSTGETPESKFAVSGEMVGKGKKPPSA